MSDSAMPNAEDEETFHRNYFLDVPFRFSQKATLGKSLGQLFRKNDVSLASREKREDPEWVS